MMIKDCERLLTERCNNRIEAHIFRRKADVYEDNLLATKGCGFRPRAFIGRTDRKVEGGARRDQAHQISSTNTVTAVAVEDDSSFRWRRRETICYCLLGGSKIRGGNRIYRRHFA
jgi:hypothetical protein